MDFTYAWEIIEKNNHQKDDLDDAEKENLYLEALIFLAEIQSCRIHRR